MLDLTENKVIKNAIRVIIDNLVPESCKVLMYVNKHEIIASDKEMETLRTSSKYKYDELIAKNNFGVVEELYTKADLNKEQRMHAKEYWK